MLLALAGVAFPANAGTDFSWVGGSGQWWSNNWDPMLAPGILSSTDIARIGDRPGVQNITVSLGLFEGVAVAPEFDSVFITNGNTLALDGSAFRATTLLSGVNSRLLVRPSSTLLTPYDFQGMIHMTPGTRLELEAGSRIALDGPASSSSGLITGRGRIDFGIGNDVGLRNQGTIEGNNNGGLTFVQFGPGRIDLDGSPAESVEGGQLSLASAFSQLRFEGEAPTDAFSGTVTMGSGSLLDMDMALGWSADLFSTFNVASGIAGAAAQIDGGHFTFGGDLNIGGSHGHLRLLADSTFTSTADVFLGTSDRLEFDGSATVQGGLYNVSSGGRIDFDGPTQIGGGTFNLVGSTPALGAMNFNSATTWSGITTINGFARQGGDATVTTPTTINATVLDMDGADDAVWTINHSLTVNTHALEQGSQQFDGTLNMNVGAVGRLTVNLADPGASWTMDGTMNLAGFGVLTTTRIAGSRMIVTGDLNMGTGLAQITANTALQGANVNINAAGTLRMRGLTTIDASTQFVGTGVLHNGLDGTMVPESGTTLSGVGLLNSGLLRIGGDGPGGMSVDRAAFTADSVWEIGIGGYAAVQRDQVTVTGATGASLGGTVAVSLLDLGIGFTPQVGDEFLILSSPQGGVSGAFINDPVTHAGGLVYEWSVITASDRVFLRLDNIVPSPGSVSLLALGGLLAARRRRPNPPPPGTPAPSTPVV